MMKLPVQMNSKFVLGSFYTENTPYQDVIMEYFVPSAMNLFYNNGVKWKIQGVENQGTWIKNVAQKPKVILEMLESIEDNKLLVFLDADTKINKYPVLFDQIPEEYDIGFHTLDWGTWYNRPENQTKELLTGTMFFRYNPLVKKLLTEWYTNAILSNKWEQKVLENLIVNFPNIKIFPIPLEYCYITSMPNGKPPFVKCDPIISHYQASRKLKRVIR